MSKKSNWYITDMDDFLAQIRSVSYEKFIEVNKTYSDEFTQKITEYNPSVDNILSEQEVQSIALPLLKKKQDGYMLNEKILHNLIEKLNSRMVSNSINLLVSKGVFEVAFDSEMNDFVFWIKDE
jgi:hypothetical protein